MTKSRDAPIPRTTLTTGGVADKTDTTNAKRDVSSSRAVIEEVPEKRRRPEQSHREKRRRSEKRPEQSDREERRRF